MSAVMAFDGDPTAEPEAFRRCLGQFATGVTVVTANIDGELVGLTVNSFASVSLNPPLILWSINVASSSYAKFSIADSFIINVLAEDQIALSRHFGRSGGDKFNDIAWSKGVNGAPILDGVAAFFECSRESEHQGEIISLSSGGFNAPCSSIAILCCLPKGATALPPIIQASRKLFALPAEKQSTNLCQAISGPPSPAM